MLAVLSMVRWTSIHRELQRTSVSLEVTMPTLLNTITLPVHTLPVSASAARVPIRPGRLLLARDIFIIPASSRELWISIRAQSIIQKRPTPDLSIALLRALIQWNRAPRLHPLQSAMLAPPAQNYHSPDPEIPMGTLSLTMLVR